MNFTDLAMFENLRIPLPQLQSTCTRLDKAQCEEESDDSSSSAVLEKEKNESFQATEAICIGGCISRESSCRWSISSNQVLCVQARDVWMLADLSCIRCRHPFSLALWTRPCI